MPWANFTNLTETYPPGSIESGMFGQTVIVYDFAHSDIIVACMIIIAGCLLYIVAGQIRAAWRKH